MEKRAWIMTGVIMVLVLAFAGAAILLQPLFWPNIYSGVKLGGVDVGGKNREEVVQLLNQWQEQIGKHHLAVTYGDKIFSVDAAGLEFQIDVAATASDAWNYGRTGYWWERLGNIRTAARQGVDIQLQVTYQATKLQALLDNWRQQIDKEPRQARFSLLHGRLIPGEPGRKVDTEAFKPQLILAMENSAVASIVLPVTVVPPEESASNANRDTMKELWALYDTNFNLGDANRSSNVRLAARKINGFILQPGQIFSFNEVVGPRDVAHGFKEAMEILDNELVPGIGGGVCQVSSTLYNAVLLSNLSIVERTNHSMPLGYISMGRDATVAYGSLDFQFINNADTPVMVAAETDGGRLVVGIVGPKPLTTSVELVVFDSRVIPPETVKKLDPELPVGETKVDKEGHQGYEVGMLRVVYQDGKEIKREFMSRDDYLPENIVIKVGSKQVNGVTDKTVAADQDKNSSLVPDAKQSGSTDKALSAGKDGKTGG
jgi:vancomycin resistance protein YoaR